MNIGLIHPRLRVRVQNLACPARLLADPSYLANRQEGARGVIMLAVVDHPGAWWVRQNDGSEAPYWFHELEADTETETG